MTNVVREHDLTPEWRFCEAGLAGFHVELGGPCETPSATLWWSGLARDEAHAAALARFDLRRSWTVLSTLRGSATVLPAEFGSVHGVKRMPAPSAVLRFHKRLWDAVPFVRRGPDPSGSELDAALLAGLRAGMAQGLPEEAATYGISYHIVHDKDDSLRRLYGGLQASTFAEMQLADPLRALALAATVAAEELGTGDSAFCWGGVAVPESATLRAALLRDLRAQAPGNAATAAELLRRLGLAAEAAALLEALAPPTGISSLVFPRRAG